MTRFSRRDLGVRCVDVSSSGGSVVLGVGGHPEVEALGSNPGEAMSTNAALFKKYSRKPTYITGAMYAIQREQYQQINTVGGNSPN